MKQDEEYKKVLKVLELEYGWNLQNSLTKEGQRLVSDTLKANKIVNGLELVKECNHKGWFIKILSWVNGDGCLNCKYNR